MSREDRPVLLFDVDGPWADFTGGYLRSLEQVCGLRFAHDVVDKYRIQDCAFLEQAAKRMEPMPANGAGEPWSAAALHRMVCAEINRPGWCRSLAPFAAAQEFHREVAETCDVYVVTSPWGSETWSYERAAWLRTHFGIEREQIISTPAKHMIRGHMLVEDNIEHANRWLDGQLHHGAKVALWETPYNRTGHLLTGGERCPSWDHVRWLLRQLRNEGRHNTRA